MIFQFEVMIFHGFGLIGIYCIWSISNSKVIENIRQNPAFGKIVSGSFFIMLEVVALRFIAPNSHTIRFGDHKPEKFMIFWNCHVLPTRPSNVVDGLM